MSLLPISWVVAVLTVWLLLWLIAGFRHSTIPKILKIDSFWLLAIFIPGFIFGKTLGLITVNIICYFTPPLRQVFEIECRVTGRRDFSTSMKGLYLFAISAGAFVILGASAYLAFA